jgi:hypothetical protein
VARVTRPCRLHSAHKGSRANNDARMACSFLPVMRLVASGFFTHDGFGCAVHLPEPSVDSALQPGAEHGLAGADGIGAGSVRNGQKAVANISKC